MKPFKTLLIVASLLIAGTTAIYAARNPEIAKTVRVNAFSQIETKSWVDIEINIGKTYSAKIVGKRDDVDKVVVKQSGQKIIVDTKNDRFLTGQHKAKVIMTTPKLTSVITGSSGDIKIKGNLNAAGESITARTMSSGDIDIQSVKCAVLTLSVESSGDIDVKKADVTQADAKILSSGDIEIKSINCDKIKAVTNSSGDIKIELINAKDIAATTNSSGDIKLQGSTNNAALTANSSGDIYASGLTATTGSASSNSSGDVHCYITGRFTKSSNSIGSVKNKAK